MLRLEAVATHSRTTELDPAPSAWQEVQQEVPSAHFPDTNEHVVPGAW